MPIRPCPNCADMTARVLSGTSADAYVWYYRCQACGHVWTIDKHDESRVAHVTPLKAIRKPTGRPAE